MISLPDRANVAHLKKQAKDLIRAYRRNDAEAIARFRVALPAATNRSYAEIASFRYRLHDAQSCVAREYGFASWVDLTSYVEARSAAAPGDRAARVIRWLDLVYSGEVTGRPGPGRPLVAQRMLLDGIDLAAEGPYLACAVGDENALRMATQADPGWVQRSGGPLNLPPLVAVTHSTLVRIANFRDGLHRSARYLLEAGASPDQRIGSRFPPASVAQPDERYPLSALYGAAGANRDADLTKLLLAAGADPNDGESLYHSLESVECAALLLRHGARVAGSNAMYRALDLTDADALELLLANGGDANEPARNAPLTEWGSPLLWAIRRRRSGRHVEALLAAGADPAAKAPSGISAYRAALQFGLPEVAEILRVAAGADALSPEEEFVAACARGDADAAGRIKAVRPDLPGALPPAQLRLLPDIVGEGGDVAARLMVEMGWPIAVRGGDWDATALNLAVFRGNAALARFLLEHGASWREEHGHGDNVRGTLSWASCNEPVEDGDWVECARTLLAHGMPGAAPIDGEFDVVLAEGRKMRFSDEVCEVLVGEADTDRGPREVAG
jgi:ankyrin repeat protein